jgi:universal stress protein A
MHERLMVTREAVMKFPISRILVPVDFSAHSEAAFRYATALAGRLGASVDLLYVVEDPIASLAWSEQIEVPNLFELRQTLITDGERRLEEFRSLAEDPAVSVVATVRMGGVAQTIIEYANTLAIDVIVMGTHGRSGLPHLFMGSVAERVLRHAPCPVLTLRDTVTEEKVGATRAATHA